MLHHPTPNHHPYRVCTTCPAVSLIPERHLTPPIPVSPDGADRDWERFADPAVAHEGDKLVQEALEAAVACVMCGGRWMRSM
jgi:general transcription factor 3C protein 4